MPTARAILTSALTLRLNRLSPGETMDADVAALGLVALNEIADEWSGGNFMLWRTLLTPSVGGVTGQTGTLGTTWPGISVGEQIEGATYNAGYDQPLEALTIEQYQESISIKSTAGVPRFYAFDGDSTVYFYPAATGQVITLRTASSMASFADLDTLYTMPQGYQSALSDEVAVRLAQPLIGQIPAALLVMAKASRSRVSSYNDQPAIISTRRLGGNILSGWN